MSTDFNFVLSANASANFMSSNNDMDDTNSANDYADSLLFNGNSNPSGLIDAFSGKDIFGTIDFSNMDTSFFANASSAETVGSVAMNSAETVGSVAFAGESAGASVSASVGGDCGGFSGGSCTFVG